LFTRAREYGGLVLTVCTLYLTSAATAEQNYRRFIIDDSAVKLEPNLSAFILATQTQIDMVHAVGLSTTTMDFFQNVGFELVPTGTFKQPTPGRYTGKGSRRVQVSAGIIRIGPKPVLLHELLHAYHDQRIPKGFRNPEILALYQQARSISAFATKSHMMANAQEYFACMATTYLFGVTAQEPFNREKIKEHQPECLAYLQELFGPQTGQFQGQLSP
jgi:hypothetical protein